MEDIRLFISFNSNIFFSSPMSFKIFFGDISQKVDPYLRPLYDAMYQMIGFEKSERLMNREIILLMKLIKCKLQDLLRLLIRLLIMM